MNRNTNCSTALPSLRPATGLDALVDGFFGTRSPSAAPWSPPAAVHETDAGYRVAVELAGVSRDAVEVTVEGKTLTIKGEKPALSTEDARAHIEERRAGRFSRVFTFPRPIEADEVKADFEHGVLTVAVSKSPEVQPRRIAIGG